MSLLIKIKVVDQNTLLLEKQRLKSLCGLNREKLENELQHLKENYPELVIKTLLPFDYQINDVIFKGTKWLYNSVAGISGDNKSKAAKLKDGKSGNVLQGVLLFEVFRIVRNFIQKKK